MAKNQTSKWFVAFFIRRLRGCKEHTYDEEFHVILYSVSQAASGATERDVTIFLSLSLSWKFLAI